MCIRPVIYVRNVNVVVSFLILDSPKADFNWTAIILYSHPNRSFSDFFRGEGADVHRLRNNLVVDHCVT